MGTPVAHLGSQTSHGGEVISCTARVKVGGLTIARVGDMVSCPDHGENAITTGSDSIFVEGQIVAHVGSQTACGSVITTGDATVTA